MIALNATTQLINTLFPFNRLVDFYTQNQNGLCLPELIVHYRVLANEGKHYVVYKSNPENSEGYDEHRPLSNLCVRWFILDQLNKVDENKLNICLKDNHFYNHHTDYTVKCAFINSLLDNYSYKVLLNFLLDISLGNDHRNEFLVFESIYDLNRSFIISLDKIFSAIQRGDKSKCLDPDNYLILSKDLTTITVLEPRDVLDYIYKSLHSLTVEELLKGAEEYPLVI